MDLPFRMVIPCVMSLLMVGLLQLYLSRTFTGRAIMAVSQDQLALQLMAADPDQDQAHRLRHLDRHRLDRRRVPDHHPAGRALGRPRIHRPRVRDLRARRPAKPARHGDRRDAARRGRKPDRDILRSVMGAGGVVRLSAADAGVPAGRTAGTMMRHAFILLLCQQHRGRRAVLRLRAMARQRLSVFRRLHRSAIHRAGDRVEHPRRLLRLREFRLGGVFRRSAPIRRWRMHKLGAEHRPLFSGFARRHRARDPAAEHPDADRDRRHRVRPGRARHRLSDAAAARRVLRHRHAGARGRAADADRQLGLRRRLARRLHHPPERGADPRQLHPISVPGHAGAVGGRDRDRAHHRAVAAGLRLRHHPRRRTRRGGLRRADAAT